MLKSAGFSMSEISNLTMPQLNAYCAEINKSKHQEFKTNILANMYGSRADSKDLDKVLKE